MPSVMTRRQLIDEVAMVIGSAHEARFIVDEVSLSDGSLDTDAVSAARVFADRRRQGTPLQYVLGRWGFRSLDVHVDERVLIPRPETEQVVGVALSELPRVAAGVSSVFVIDMGTGSGVIAMSLALEGGPSYGSFRVLATDVDRRALECAELNLEILAGSNRAAAQRVTLAESSWWDGVGPSLRGTVQMVVSNPPYVSEAEWPELDPVVKREPWGALVAADGSDGTPGLAGVEAVLAGAVEWLARPGVAVIELAPHQAEAATVMAWGFGADDVRVAADLTGRQRALVARFG